MLEGQVLARQSVCLSKPHQCPSHPTPCSDAMFVEDLPGQGFVATPEAKDPTDRSLALLDQRVQAVNEIGIDAFDGLNDREVEM